MDVCSQRATDLDWAMIVRNRGGDAAAIAPRGTPDAALAERAGAEVARELGGRYLVKYLPRTRLHDYQNGSPGTEYATPTMYTPSEAPVYLNLPYVEDSRLWALFLDPGIIDVVLGPRWVELGQGIEY